MFYFMQVVILGQENIFQVLHSAKFTATISETSSEKTGGKKKVNKVKS